jgi:nucleotide-binding universal stress UspA family protein
MKKHILCSVDFSPSCASASLVAAALGTRLGVPLTLVHVTEHGEPGSSEARQYLEAAAAERLHQEAERLRKTGAEVKELLLHGPIHKELGEWAEKSEPFVIVTAARMKPGIFERWLMSGVTERLVQIAPAPILVIRDATVLEEWLAGGRKLRIFVAADLSFTSNAPLQWVGEFARIAPCEITIGYLNWIPDETMRLGIKGPLKFSSNPPELSSLLMRDLREKARSIRGDIPVEICVEPRWGRADLPSIEMAQRNRADLIVAGSRSPGERKLFDEAVSLGILHHAPLNVAIVPTCAMSTAELPLAPARRILVATDFSDLGNTAIPAAYSLLSMGGFVRLLHVKSGPGEDSTAIADKLRALVPVEAAERDIHTEISVVENRQTAEGICQSAAQFGADIICLSTHGRSGLAQSLLGSVAHEVVARDDRPVLLIPKPS